MLAAAGPEAVADPIGESLHHELHTVEADDGQRLALTEVRRPDGGVPQSEHAFLLLHGFAQNRRAYTLGPMPGELLARGARVFVGELRGHGESRVESGPAWTPEMHLELDCPALIDGCRRLANVDRIHFVGHSMGGLLGCAMLGREAPFASFTAAATPLLLGAARPLVRLASLLVGPLATVAPRPRRVPMHHFLGLMSAPLSSPGARGPLRLLQRLTRLANPAAADPAAIREILASADPESPAVMEELARNAVLLRPRFAGVDLVGAVKQAVLPVGAIVGSSDIFAPRAAIAPLEEPGQAGPRKIVEIERGTHVDSIMGYHVPETVGALWDFLTSDR